MAIAKHIIPGEKFHRLTVIAEAPMRPGRQQRRVTAKCDCGSIGDFVLTELRTGHTKSCGCARYDYAKNYGTRGHTARGSASPEYFLWKAMIARCENEKNNRFDRYGAKGISVCKEWHNFEQFLSDMGRRPSLSHTIDRIDNLVGYKPGNCRWATYGEQAENRRSTRLIDYQGRIQSITAWAREVGLPAGAVNIRIVRLGWSIDRALTEPVRRGKNQHR
jgi:hypothetical protein